MDAKAKVACWIRPDLIAVLDKCRNDTHNGTVDVWMRQVDESYVPLIPLTDHEAALAELAERHAATERNACLMAELANEEKRKRQELITGLEALAGELSERVEYASHPGGFSDEWVKGANYARSDSAKRIRTLTNSAKQSSQT